MPRSRRTKLVSAELKMIPSPPMERRGVVRARSMELVWSWSRWLDTQALPFLGSVTAFQLHWRMGEVLTSTLISLEIVELSPALFMLMTLRPPSSTLVTQVINRVMLDGKKATAEHIVYQALEDVGQKTGQSPVEVLERAGASFKDVVRTRMYLTHVDDWQAVGRVHGEIFRDIRPAATMLVVAQLLNPNWRVEIELDAVVESDSAISTGAKG